MDSVEINVRHRGDPVEFPARVVKYFLDKAATWEGSHPTRCAYCADPVETGDRIFEIQASFDDPIKRGHLSHVAEAPPRDWTPDPQRKVTQPWDEPGYTGLRPEDAYRAAVEERKRRQL